MKHKMLQKNMELFVLQIFGYNDKLELNYRGRIKELKNLKPVNTGKSDLLSAMRMIVKTGKGPKNQIPSMGCNIKWVKYVFHFNKKLSS